MKRSTFNIVFLVICALAAAALFLWDAVATFGMRLIPGHPELGCIVLALFVVVIVALLYNSLAEIYAPHQVKLRHEMSPQEYRAQAEREALLAIKQGRIGTALLIYEDAGLYAKALQLAQELKDRSAVARLHAKMGGHARARKLYLELNDFEAAANMSALMNEVDTARQYYRMAAENCKDTAAVEAGLWDRAGDRRAAARLYERAGDLEHAAECYTALGDKSNASRCAMHAKAMDAYERKQRSLSREMEDRRMAGERIASANRAKKMEDAGDLFGAGDYYRKAEMWMEAASAFERFEEWERAAAAFQHAGLPDRAEMARMRIERPEAAEEEESLPAPPSEAAPARFAPVARTVAVPVFVGASGRIERDPVASEEVAKRVRRGNFIEAADLAKKANDWLMAAAYYERAGAFVPAADIYRQIGNVNAGAWCLEKGGRRKEAILMALAGGQAQTAVDYILKGIRAGEDVGEMEALLAEELIKWGKHALAREWVEARFAQGQMSQANAQACYRFARLLEESEAEQEALALYRKILEAGALSEDVSQRVERLTKIPVLGTDAKPAPDPAKPDRIDLAVRALLDEMKAAAAAAAGVTLPAPIPPRRQAILIQAQDAAGDIPATAMLKGGDLSLFGLPWEGKEGQGGPEDPFAVRRRYNIEKEIARGGMGVVYVARDAILGRQVALKLILRRMASDPDALRQFLLEARAVAMVTHPNIVVVYDVGLMDLQHYIAMELVAGGSLARLVANEGRLPLKEALRLFIEMCRAVDVAHKCGVLHRDIKPENVLLTAERGVKIVDFGLAQIGGNPAHRGEAGVFRASGTPGYMAPEQSRGMDLKPCCDIYALGITLFHMLAGAPPFKLANKTSLMDILEFQEAGRLPSLREQRPEVSEDIDQIYRYCAMAKPEERYQSIDAFLPAIEQRYKSL